MLAAPQLASWLAGDPDPTQAVVALAGFWLVNIIAAAGEEVRIRRDDLRPSSAILVLANATFLLWGIFVVLDGDLAAWRGFAIALASLAHLLVGGWFLLRQGWEHLFGNLVAGTGVALLAIAAFVQLGAPRSRSRGPPRPSRSPGWPSAAVTAGRRARRSSSAGWRSRTSSWSSIRFGRRASRPRSTFDPPLLNPEGGSLLAVLLALAVTVALVPVRWIRSALAAVGVLLVAYAVTFAADGSGPRRRAGADRAGRAPAGPAGRPAAHRGRARSRSPAGRLRLVRLGRRRGGRR